LSWRDDDHAGLAEILVPTDVIAVPVGVHQEMDRLVGDRLDRRDDLRCQRRELVVDEEHAVLARETPMLPPSPSSM